MRRTAGALAAGAGITLAGLALATAGAVAVAVVSPSTVLHEDFGWAGGVAGGLVLVSFAALAGATAVRVRRRGPRLPVALAGPLAVACPVAVVALLGGQGAGALLHPALTAAGALVGALPAARRRRRGVSPAGRGAARRRR